jgi:Domain of unknown function (DUF4124)
MRLIPVTVLILASAFTLARADVYRWVDEHGVPHYSDQWVPGSEVIKTTKNRPADGAIRAEQKNVAALNQAVAKDLVRTDNARGVQQDVAKAREVQCQKARDGYNHAIAARTLYSQDKNGDRVYMSEAQSTAMREQARQNVLDACGSVPRYDPEAPLSPQPQALVPQPEALPEPKPLPANSQ